MMQTLSDPDCKKQENSSNNLFEEDVVKGLTSSPKSLSSKYFYDDEGSRLFQEIMRLPEYYLTRAEEEIFLNSVGRLREVLTENSLMVQVTELGAGDGLKSRILIRELQQAGVHFLYNAIDISDKALLEFQQTISGEMNSSDLRLIHAEYFEGLHQIQKKEHIKNVLLFLGSNIGNFDHETSVEFLRKINHQLQKGDLLLVGFDLKKSSEIIFNAYNDRQGVTGLFNLNLLNRINKELHANFDLALFEHLPVYDSEKGEARSYLRSKATHTVFMGKTGTTVHFETGELIHTEISRKYDLMQIQELATLSGFQVAEIFFDSKKYFCDALYIK